MHFEARSLKWSCIYELLWEWTWLLTGQQERTDELKSSFLCFRCLTPLCKLFKKYICLKRVSLQFTLRPNLREILWLVLIRQARCFFSSPLPFPRSGAWLSSPPESSLMLAAGSDAALPSRKLGLALITAPLHCLRLLYLFICWPQ